MPVTPPNPMPIPLPNDHFTMTMLPSKEYINTIVYFDYTIYTCALCDGPFESLIDWDERHTYFDTEGVHAKCCTVCPGNKAAQKTTNIPTNLVHINDPAPIAIAEYLLGGIIPVDELDPDDVQYTMTEAANAAIDICKLVDEARKDELNDTNWMVQIVKQLNEIEKIINLVVNQYIEVDAKPIMHGDKVYPLADDPVSRIFKIKEILDTVKHT